MSASLSNLPVILVAKSRKLLEVQQSKVFVLVFHTDFWPVRRVESVSKTSPENICDVPWRFIKMLTWEG
jgi:hypothetical protein